MKGEEVFDWKEGFPQVFIGQGNQFKEGSSERLIGLETILLVGCVKCCMCSRSV